MHQVEQRLRHDPEEDRRSTRDERHCDHLGLAEIVAQVRSTAIDLMRAAEAGASVAEPVDVATEELLVELPAPA